MTLAAAALAINPTVLSLAVQIEHRRKICTELLVLEYCFLMAYIKESTKNSLSPCRLRQVSSVNLLESISCISVVLDHQSKHASHLLVALEKGKLIIVSVADIPSHKS